MTTEGTEAKFNVGDQVYIYASGYRGLAKGVISRVTKTQAIVANGRFEQKFNRQSGRLIGGRQFDTPSISHRTDRLDAEWHQQKIRAARRELAEVARGNNGDDAHVLRAAFEKWDRLQGGTDA